MILNTTNYMSSRAK